MKRYQLNSKVMKKAEELYTRMKDMYLNPHSVATPLQRRTLVTSRKTGSAMADYMNKVSAWFTIVLPPTRGRGWG